MQSFKLLGLATVTLLVACNDKAPATAENNDNIEVTRRLEGEELAKRGKYLTTIGGCNDCHTPKIFNDRGFVFDETKTLSGHPSGSKLPPINASAMQPGQWINMAPDLTAFVGPWGISYTANLTPDSATGTGAWTKEMFIKALRTGKHMGADNGRPIMPPMPWEEIRKMTDEDLEAVFAFLHSLPAINNRVPDPVPPAQVKIN